MVVHEMKILILKSRDIGPKSSDEDRSSTLCTLDRLGPD